jgi:hypothetical protein
MSDDRAFDVSTCNSCSAPVIWARTTNGKSMPVDAEPTEQGNVELLPLVAGVRTPEAVVHPQHPLGAGPLRTSHFATCPHADQWRSKVKARRRSR